MNDVPPHHHRHSIRLPGYDYGGSGAYFVTIVTQNRVCLLGTIHNGIMTPSPAGEMAQTQWDTLPRRFPTIELDAFVVMPNHIHAVIRLVGDAAGASTRDAPTRAAGDPNGVGVPLVGTPVSDAPTHPNMPTLGDVVGAWKSLTTVAYISGVNAAGWPPFAGRLWQRNYYEHIVRDDEDLARIRHYIATNPQHWTQDAEYLR